MDFELESWKLWVENDYNERQGYALRFGAAPHGVGLTMNF